MENNLVKRDTFQVTEIEIRDHALVSGYQSKGNCVLDINLGPMEIYFLCVRHGRIGLQISFIPHPLELSTSEGIFFANPKSDWFLKIQAVSATDFFVMKMEVPTLHKLINPTFDEHQLEPSHNMNMRNLMRLIPISPQMMNCFDQLLHHKLSQPFDAMFKRAKFLEIFSQLMESSFGQPMNACPVAMSPAIEMKLSQVRRHIIEHVDEIPDPDALARLYELPRNTLREGYRFVYGKTIHQFHSDHKLESAMQMLTSGELLVKEVAFKIGYQNPSHFISAFKKKYGYTPKQFFKREAVSVP